MITKNKKGPANKRGNSFTLTMTLSDQNKESKHIDMKLKMGRFRGEWLKDNFSLLIILKPQNIKLITTNNAKTNFLAGENTVIQKGYKATGTRITKRYIDISIAFSQKVFFREIKSDFLCFKPFKKLL